MNPTLVVKVLSRSRKGTKLGIVKTKTEKSDLFCGDSGGTVSTLIQMTTGFSAWSEEYGFTKDVTMKGL
jgi:hypothetical protein